MADASFIAGDWGTSHLRLFLCDGDGRIVDRARAGGAADAAGRFAAIFDGLVAPWLQQHGPLPAVLCGMVGSSIGWMQAPYMPCPAIPEQIAAGCVSLRHGGVHIVPGVSCRNRLDAPDFMRGEETQILGALHIDPSLGRGHRLLCLPGTHTKWVALQDGAIVEFLTAPTGELFALLRDHSVLLHQHAERAPAAADVDIDAVAFAQALARCNQLPPAPLLHRLFECRGRRLSGELTPQAAAAYLSGLLIASDIGGALQLLPAPAGARNVHLIGDSQLTQLYAQGLAAQQHTVTTLEGSAASLAGLAHVYRQLTQRRVVNAVH
jgi:2-dehydro-3-deoxygalactonokinase